MHRFSVLSPVPRIEGMTSSTAKEFFEYYTQFPRINRDMQLRQDIGCLRLDSMLCRRSHVDLWTGRGY